MFARLFLLIGLVSSLSLGVVAGLLWRNSIELERQLRRENDEAGARVLQNGTRLLEANLSDTHLLIVRQKARTLESYFTNIADTLELEARLVRQFLSDNGSLSDAPPLFEGNELTKLVRAKPQLQKTLRAVQPYAMYDLSPGVPQQKVNNSLQRLRRLGAFFAHTQQTLPGCDSLYFGSAQGFILGYPGGKSFFKPTYDARRRPWYQQAVARPSGEIIWLVDTDRNGYLLWTCARTVTLPGASQTAGVAAIDANLLDVQSELFNVGSLSVSRAVLVDSEERVRIRAFYDQAGNDKNARPTFDNRDVQAKPPLAKVPGFSAIAAHIRANPTKNSGIFWDGKDSRKGMETADSVFIYSVVRFDTRAGQAQAKDNWHYIVQLPMKPLLAPLNSVTSEMRGATQGISQAIEVRTRKSAALVLGLIGATLLVALGVAYFAARATSRPLMQMAQVARGVGQGNLDQQAPETSGGEIGEMGRAINAMISGLRQRNLLQETFSRYTAPTVVQEILRRGGVQLGGVKSEATIFFSDLAGFTTLSEKLPPEELVALLNEYLDAMTKIIIASEGMLDKYIGDAILAFWGSPIAREDDAARACRAALDQRAQLRLLRDKWAKEGRPLLDMRIGIETGEVIVGDIGSELKLNYTVLGDTVNFASRLEAVNKIYGSHILIGERTRHLAGDAIEVRELDLLAVAGKSQPVRVYELLGMAGEMSLAQRNGYALYGQGLKAYRERQWDEAEEHIKLAQEALGADKACEVLLSRIQQCRVNPPPPNWDGTLILEHK
ncbi:MAG TPA: adenylate/guanylate cyclase domain-containing protein [Abditibacteriaceae bacterium]